MKIYKLFICITFISIFLYGCEGKEKQITPPKPPAESVGNLSQVKIYPGKNRVRLTGIPNAEIKKVVISWDNTSATIDITQNMQAARLVDAVIPVTEGEKTFKIVAYNASAKASDEIVVKAVAYGDAYRATLYNKPIISLLLKNGSTEVLWAKTTSASGTSRIEYTYNTSTGTAYVNDESTTTNISGLNIRTTGFAYRTIYEPAYNGLISIDTFATDVRSIGKLPVGITTSNLKRISRVTGASLPGETFPNPTPTTQWSVGATDLGIMWDMGNGRTGLFFGDTYGNDFRPTNPPDYSGGPNNAGQWRYNVFGYSDDINLEDGLSISGMATSPANPNYALLIMDRLPGSHTAIPSSAINVDGVDYVQYWNLQTWNGWVTNFSSMYKSVDHGASWQRCNEINFPRGSKFACITYGKKDGYVYMLGTPTLRGAAVYLARCLEKDMLSQNNYEYWNGAYWVKQKEDVAVPVFDAPFGEASLVYNTTYNRWIVTYLGAPDIMLRDAKDLTGPWTEAKVMVKASEYGGLYGPFIHPHSKGNNLYFNMSLWWPYNVFFMKTSLNYSE